MHKAVSMHNLHLLQPCPLNGNFILFIQANILDVIMISVFFYVSYLITKKFYWPDSKYIRIWSLFISPTYSPDPRSYTLLPLLLQNLQTRFSMPSPVFLSVVYSQYSSHTDLQIRHNVVLLLISLYCFSASHKVKLFMCSSAPQPLRHHLLIPFLHLLDSRLLSKQFKPLSLLQV